MLMLCMGADAIVYLLLTEKWMPIVPFLRVLSMIGILYPLHLINIQLLVSQGQSRLNFRITVVKNLLRIINVVVMVRYGVLFIIIGELIVSLLSLVIITYFTKSTVSYGLMRQFWETRSVWFSILLSAILGWLSTQLTDDYYFQLISLFIIIGGSFTAIQYLLNKELLLDLKDVLLKPKSQ